ncbi:MAG: hypothetical protein ABEJ40_02880 [Haloarculaceae archaeon]
MSLSKMVFRFLLVIFSFFALLTAFLFVLQKPGSAGWVISIVTLVIQCSFLLFLAVALYLDWQPLDPLEEML